MFLAAIWKLSDFLSEHFQFLVVKFSKYLNRHVFVMIQAFSGRRQMFCLEWLHGWADWSVLVGRICSLEGNAVPWLNKICFILQLCTIISFTILVAFELLHVELTMPVSILLFFRPSYTHQTHNVAARSLQRRCNVVTLQQRCNGVVATLCVCWVLCDVWRL